MPQINLLTPSLGKKAKKAKATEKTKIEIKQISKILFPVAGITIFIILCLWVVLGFQVSSKNKALQALLAKEKTFSVDPQELVRLNDVKEGLEERVSFLEGLLFSKFLWSGKLAEISKVIPFGVWLTNISIEKRRLKLEGSTDESKGKYRVLFIKGKAVSPKIQDAIDLIGKFHLLLKENRAFSKDFIDIELKSVSKDTIAKTDVMSFELNCPFR